MLIVELFPLFEPYIYYVLVYVPVYTCAVYFKIICLDLGTINLEFKTQKKN